MRSVVSLAERIHNQVKTTDNGTCINQQSAPSNALLCQPLPGNIISPGLCVSAAAAGRNEGDDGGDGGGGGNYISGIRHLSS